MAELAENESDLVTEQSRGVIQTLSERIDGANCGGEVGGRSKVTKTEHGTVSLEKRELSVEQSLLEIGD